MLYGIKDDNMQTLGFSLKAWQTDDWIGLWVTIIILSLWFVSLGLSFLISISFNSWLYSLGLTGVCLLRAYLQTGLFIVAHDSMHGNLIPHDRLLNNFLGRIAVSVYAFLAYDLCYLNHSNHHRYPSQNGDPDFHGGVSNPLFWYCKFICAYFPKRSLIVFITNVGWISTFLILIFKVPFINLILFWLVPLVLSSLQLFYFGTYLPHRLTYCQENPYFAPRLTSNRYDLLWALCSCYNFGHYHWEHHAYPQTPWYRLPFTLINNQAI